ncbi:DUF2889 domain-containing protein [Candidatus Peregrinibacteria bacterium]|nr:DUF2889 domain-containing protein [Candidatus Peregrinibacteria bacterium]
MPPSAPSSEYYQRTIQTFLTTNPDGTRSAVAAIEDPVHHMELMAQVNPEGILNQVCVADRSRPFNECRTAIARSGTVWNEVDLKKKEMIHDVRKRLDGCAHIAELVRYLSFAFQKKLDIYVFDWKRL